MTRRLALGLFLLVVAGAAFWLLWPKKPPALSVAERREIVQTIVSSGQVMPPSEIHIDALVTAPIISVEAREGDHVKAGQLLVVLDDADLRAQLKQAEALLAQARVGHASVRQVSFPEATESAIQAEANLRNARTEERRKKALLDAGVITKEAYEEASRALTVFESQAKAATLQVKAVKPGGNQRLSAQAQVALAQAQVAVAKANLRRAEVRSPTDAIIVERLVESGESVRPGSRLVVLSSEGRTRVSIEPDERNLATLELGQSALLSAEAFPDKHFLGVVAYIAPAVNAQRGTVEVRLDVPDPPEYLRPNMTVSVEVTVAHKRDALVVPLSVVQGLEAGQPWVTIWTGNRGSRQDVSLGLRGDTHVEVLTGISVGQEILVPDARSAPRGPEMPGAAR
ncbi:MAG: efflux RND transporter periplasmic adaptor subunit [Polyangiaceae bacterium]|nr:efflux RND transporter periplasmic adaptor subunit [Myxococcales bacterium]MCB9587181.1 efflux RND transporter periplasmic adaptor subunit [Polyangiaceae bacterium]